MAKDSIELALSVLEAERANLSPEHHFRLVALTFAGKSVRENVTDTLVTRGKSELSPEQQAALLSVLEARFSRRPEHYEQVEGVNFTEVKKALEANPEAMCSLAQMEGTGGLPDIIAVEDDAFVFGDCSAESPNRRNLTYNQAAEAASRFGVELMPEDIYRKLQNTTELDKNSRSWLATPDHIMESGYQRRALHGTRIGGKMRVRKVIPNHQYSNRGWRGVLRVSKVA